jgi:Flp pilus assembly protein CpaB
MVMTQPERGASPGSDDRAVPSSRRITRRSGMPGGRAMAGGLLVALAGVGTFVAWQRSTGTPGTSYAVAARTIRPGERVSADDLRLEPVDLPDGVAAAAFAGSDDLVGRVTLGPVAEGELLQRGQLSDRGHDQPAVEVSFAIDRDRALDGRLRSGDRVDVFVTDAGRTAAVSEGVQVVAVGGGDGSSFSGDRKVTITVSLAEPAARAPLIHALREGDVTLVRSTHRTDPPVTASGAPPDAHVPGPDAAGPDTFGSAAPTSDAGGG